MFGVGYDFDLLSFCSRIAQKVITLSDRYRKTNGLAFQRDRHIRRRLLKIESLECRALMSADGLATTIDPGWFMDLTSDSSLHSGSASLSTSTISPQTAQTSSTSTQSNTYDWIVQFNTQSLSSISSVSQVSSLLVGSGIDFQVMRGLGIVGQALVRSTGVSYDTVTNWFSHNSNIAAFEQDSVRQFQLTPNDPGTGQLYSMTKINASSAWNLTTGSKSVVVGVIDTGIDYNHPDLAANVWKNPGEIAGNGIDDDGNGFVDDVYGFNFVSNTGNVMDDNGHGTHVSGTIAAVGNNSRGVVGVNWNTSVMALKFLDNTGSGYISNAILAVNYATMMKSRYGVNIKVLNNSWGGGGYSAALDSAIQASNNAGILFVAAAGNSGTNNDTTAQYPANFTSPNVISVAASDQNDQLASFSCYGASTVDLAAPGVSIYSTLPNNRYGIYSGTSMATPLVSGVAALAWAYKPNASVTDIRNALLNGVDHISSLSGKVASGGRLNAYNTLQLLGAAPTTPVVTPPALGSLSLSQASVAQGASVTLIAQGASASNGVSAVSFYYDANGNGVLDSGDTILGSDTTIVNGTAELPISTSGLAAGSYRFFSRTLDTNNQWSAALSTTLTVTAPLDDYGNSPATASAITVGSTINGSIETGGDQDWFKFQAVAGKKYTISTSLVGLADSVLAIYGPNGTTRLAYNDDASASTRASKIVWTAPISGTYYIKTNAYSVTQTGAYKLSVALSNTKPVLASLSDQTMSYRTDKIVVPLSASDADGDRLSYSFTAYTIDARTQARTPIASSKVALSFANNNLTIDPAAGFTGAFFVDASVSDGLESVTKTFKVSVGNSAPTINAIGSKILSSTTGTVTIPLSVRDLDGDRITLSAQAYTVDPATKLPTSTQVPSGKVSLSISGNQLRITRAAGYSGDFYVKVTASDGISSTVQSFKVTATTSNVKWLTNSNSVGTRSIEDISSQLDLPENATTVYLPASEINNYAWIGTASLTQSYDIMGSTTRVSSVSSMNNNTTSNNVDLAFHESHTRNDSWVADNMDHLSNVLSNSLTKTSRTLSNSIDNHIGNTFNNDRDAESNLLQAIDESLQSLDEYSYDAGSIDELFAALSDA